MTLILSGTDGLSDIDGSAATPAIRGTDANTGIFFPAADTIAFSEGGTEAMRIDSSGNVGVGTSSPAQALEVLRTSNPTINITETSGSSTTKLAFLGATTAERGALSLNFSTAEMRLATGVSGNTYFQTFYTNGSERARIDSSGNVGIGTSSPAVKLHIETSSGSAAFFVNSPSATDVGSYISLRKAGSAKFLLGVESTLGGTSDNGVLYVYGANALTMHTNGSERARIDSSGRLMLGTTTTSISSLDAKYFDGADGQRLFSSRGSTASREHVIFQNPNGTVGTISTSGSATTYATSSDYRLKHDITPMTGALAKVAALKPVTYKWNADDSAGEGFIAHELQAVVPQCVTGEKDAVYENGDPKYQGIDTSFLVATLTAAIQELKAINDAQAQTIQSLTARIEALEGK